MVVRYVPHVRPADRIRAMKAISVGLSAEEWPDIRLVLREHGLRYNDEYESDKRQFVIDMLDSVGDEVLTELFEFVTGQDLPGGTSRQPGPTRIFMSHLATQQGYVGEVGKALDWYGCRSFVAHTGIEGGAEWEKTIESNLRDCDVMVAFLHDGFIESKWCDQEVGFAMARRVPIIPVNFGTRPYGFLARFQALQCHRDLASAVAMKVLDSMGGMPQVAVPLTESFVAAFEAVGSYNSARNVYSRLITRPSLSLDQLTRLRTATQQNPEITNAVLAHESMPNLIEALIARHGGIPVPAPIPEYSDEPPF